jgi:hypothetical protein
MSSTVLSINQWTPSEQKYGLPKVNKQGGKSINLYSKQTNKFLELSTPRMMTWGISDFYDKEKDTHDGKFSMTLNFPNQEFETQDTTMFLNKLKEFNEVILNDAFENREKWWDGQEKIPESKELLRYTMYPVLKYPKNKDTKKIDMTRAPSITAKVECYDGKWKPRVFNTSRELIFPSANPDHEGLTPADFVPKMSNVSCTIECAGIWIGGKGWGVSWRLKQCVVKPPNEEQVSSDVCQVFMSPEDVDQINSQKVKATGDIEIDEDTATVYKAARGKPRPVETYAEDSDDDGLNNIIKTLGVTSLLGAVSEPVKPVAEEEKQPLVEEEKQPQVVAAAAEPAKKVVKKVVKKAVV